MFSYSKQNATQKSLYDRAMTVMDNNYAPPLLWDTAKLSTWYAVGLLGRDAPGDRESASRLIKNALTQQYSDVDFVQNLHSFKDTMEMPLASGEDPLWVSDIYDSYDPNNALFVAMAFILVDSLYADKVDGVLLKDFRESVHRAIRGNIPRMQGWFGDDMCASYSNPFFMRCACAAYMGKLMDDNELRDLSDSWTKEATVLWRKYDSPGEFNSPTYAGITLMALGLAQFCPPESEIYKVAPELLQSTWRSLGETYNPSLRNVAGPWDRGYGYCMTRYFACVGVNIATIVQDASNEPIPYNLDGCPHYTDVALIPMQMMVSAYVDGYAPKDIKQRLTKLVPHDYVATSDFAPFDVEPRQYTYCLREGLSVGGVRYNETRMGGPKGDMTQFIPGVVQWDSGKHGGGVGWIAVYPTGVRADIIATESSLSVSFPPSSTGLVTSKLVLHISCLPFLQLNKRSCQGEEEELPGLTVRLDGNIAVKATRTLRFDNTTINHMARYYELVFDFEGMMSEEEVPTLVVGLTKTAPPEYPFVW